MSETIPKPFVFVLMPFAKDFDDVYQLGVKPACKNAGAYAERVDEQSFEGSITQRIYNQIAKADVIVADLTGRNPNVFYETGYAHALGKNVILITQNVDDIPFDLKDYPHIVYGGRIVDLIPELEKKARWCLEHSGESLALALPHLSFYFDGTNILNNPIISHYSRADAVHYFALKFDIANSVEKLVRSETFQISINTSSRIAYVNSGPYGRVLNSVKLSDERSIHVFPDSFDLFPGSWISITIDFNTMAPIEKGVVEQMSFQISTKSAIQEYPFRVRFLTHQEFDASMIEEDSP